MKISDLFEYTKLFYSYAGNWMFVILFLILLGTMLEGLGISLLAPLLTIGTGSDVNDGLTGYIFKIFDYLNIPTDVKYMLLLIVVTLLAKNLIAYMQLVITYRVQLNIRKRIQRRLLELFSKMNYQHYIETSSGNLNNLVVREVPRFMQSFMEFTRMPASITHLLIYAAIITIINPQLLPILIGCGILIHMFVKPLIFKTKSMSINVSKISGELQANIVEYLQNIPYLKVTNATVPVKSTINSRINDMGVNETGLYQMASFFKVINEPIAVIFLASFIYLQVEIQGGSLGEVLILALLLYRMVNRITQLQGVWNRFYNSIGGVDSVQGFLETVELEAVNNDSVRVESLMEPLTLSDVDFSYKNKKVLNNITLRIEPRTTTAIVGPSGSGKTTIFYLLTGLLAPSSGQVKLGDKDLASIDKQSFRSKIGYVPQEPVILNESMLNNILLWRVSPDDNVMKKVSQIMMLAGCGNLTGKLDSQLGERGVKLSGGEKQRLAITRELLMDPELLIFDEATSSLDSHSEEIIQDSINNMHGERTVVLIAHRLSTVRNCDYIYVMSKGEVIESGTFDELYRHNGFFRKMCEKQGLS